MNLNKLFYECEHCGKKIIKQKTFEAHNCEAMKRFKLFKTKKGQGAYRDYEYWMKVKTGKATISPNSFMNSRFFNMFVNFQTWASEQGLPNKKMYIETMVELTASPILWQRKDFYEKFIQMFDERMTPMEKVEISIKMLESLAKMLECSVGEVIGLLLPSEISRLIYERRLSPWLLLLSDKFKHYLHMIEDQAQYLMIASTIDVQEWTPKFRKAPKTVKKIKAIIQEYEL